MQFLAAVQTNRSNLNLGYSMKLRFLSTLVLSLILAACGGGGSGGTSGANDTANSIADTSSPSYTAGLKMAAEINAASAFMLSAHDLVMFAGQTGACPQGGSLNYATPTQTLTQCRRNYPQDGAYTGTYSGTTNASGLSVTAINGVQVFDFSNLTSLQYTLASGSFSGASTEVSATTDETSITSGTVAVNVGSSTYTLSQFNSKVNNNGSSLNITPVNTAAKLLQVSKGSNTYDVTLNQVVQITGNNFPNAGSISVSFTTTACTPMVLTYLPSNRFNLSCGGHSITKGWEDADVVAARNAAKQ